VRQAARLGPAEAAEGGGRLRAAVGYPEPHGGEAVARPEQNLAADLADISGAEPLERLEVAEVAHPHRALGRAVAAPQFVAVDHVVDHEIEPPRDLRHEILPPDEESREIRQRPRPRGRAVARPELVAVLTPREEEEPAAGGGGAGEEARGSTRREDGFGAGPAVDGPDAQVAAVRRQREEAVADGRQAKGGPRPGIGLQLGRPGRCAVALPERAGAVVAAQEIERLGGDGDRRRQLEFQVGQPGEAGGEEEGPGAGAVGAPQMPREEIVLVLLVRGGEEQEAVGHTEEDRADAADLAFAAREHGAGPRAGAVAQPDPFGPVGGGRDEGDAVLERSELPGAGVVGGRRIVPDVVEQRRAPDLRADGEGEQQGEAEQRQEAEWLRHGTISSQRNRRSGRRAHHGRVIPSFYR
jgi:hypothetical protein